MRVVELPGHIPEASERISPHAVRRALEGAGVECLVTVPESPYEMLLRDLIGGSSIRIVQVCRESEGVSVAAGLTYGGKATALLCSYKGLYNSVDSLLGVALKTQASFLLMVSEAEQSAEKRARSLEHGHHTVELLAMAQIPYYEIKSDSDVHYIGEAMARTNNETHPVAVVLRW